MRLNLSLILLGCIVVIYVCIFAYIIVKYIKKKHTDKDVYSLKLKDIQLEPCIDSEPYSLGCFKKSILDKTSQICPDKVNEMATCLRPRQMIDVGQQLHDCVENICPSARNTWPTNDTHKGDAFEDKKLELLDRAKGLCSPNEYNRIEACLLETGSLKPGMLPMELSHKIQACGTDNCSSLAN